MRMLAFLFCWILYAAISVNSLYADANVLINPGFELGISDWQGRGAASISYESAQPRSGIYCGRAYDRTNNWHGIQQNMIGKMVAGETYQISGWVKTSSSSQSDIHITFQKNDDSNNGDPQYRWTASGKADSSGWTYISGSYTLEVTGVLSQLIFYIEGPDAGIDIFVDNLSVYGPEVIIDTNAEGLIDINTKHQMIEGFGAAGAWYEGWLTSHPKREELYDLLFGNLGLDIYRLRNTYDQGTSGADFMNKSAQIITEAKERNPDLKIMISSWSPPAYLKSNGEISGGNNATLIGGPGNYDYAGFAQWWADSITAWNSLGIYPDYISIQNEPDYDASWDSCRFDPTENSNIAGYNKAFEAVYLELHSRFDSSMPKMIGPEATGFHGASGNNLDAYLSAFTNHDNVYGYCHHMYNINAGDNPDSYLSAFSNVNNSWGNKPLFQTEYEKSNAAWPDALNMANLLHNALTVEEVSGYFYWSLYWAEPGGLISFPSYGSSSYTINSDLYGFGHYSAFIHSGWQRISAAVDSQEIRISAYLSPDKKQMSSVIINTSPTSDIDLSLSFPGITISSGNIYRTSETENCIFTGNYIPDSPLSLPASSITTIVLNLEYLYGDINTDNSVDIIDMSLLASFWLQNNCNFDLNNNCIIELNEFGAFAENWLK